MIMSYEQLQDEVDKICNAISQGGGGGGSTVSVVSKRNTGENIADITVNNTTTQLYAPDSASDVSFDPSVKGVYTGTNTQSVVDEITDDIISLNDTITKFHSGIATYSGTGSTGVDVTIQIGKTLSNTNYVVITSNGGDYSYVTIRLKSKSLDKFVVSAERSSAMGSGSTGYINWLVIEK